MKQYVDQSDIDALPQEMRDVLYQRFEDPFLSIGQMIELLYDQFPVEIHPHNGHLFCRSMTGRFQLTGLFEHRVHYDELFDALWGGVKEILAREGASKRVLVAMRH